MKKTHLCFALHLLFLLALVFGLHAAHADASPKIAPFLRPYVDNGTMAGAVVLVGSPEKILDVEAVGYMNLAAKKPMQTDSVFWIASQSKPITGAALMILVDEGKVDVDDPVEKYLPEFKGQLVIAEKDDVHVLLKKPLHPILVRDVLTHTSGLPFKSPIETPRLDLYPLETRVRSYAMLPLQTEPGAKYTYSNAGINTAGRIVEVVSGKAFAQFLEERLFKPLGMKDTTFWPTQAQQERLATAYRTAKADGTLEECQIDQLTYPLDSCGRQPMPAGGLFSTAQDLCTFYQMLANNGMHKGRRILSEKSVQQMTSDQSGAAHAHYGFGIGAGEGGFTHGGAYGTNSRYDRTARIINIFLVQKADGWTNDGKSILPLFQKTALALFGAGKSGGEQETVGIPGQGTTPLVPTPETKAGPAK